MGEMDDFLGLGGIGSIPKKLLRDRKSKIKAEPKEWVPFHRFRSAERGWYLTRRSL
jgi:hypothetical protein